MSFNRCEGKLDCVVVCPQDVFEVRRIDDDDFAALGLIAKVRVAAHGRQVAYTPNADQCRACGLCGSCKAPRSPPMPRPSCSTRLRLKRADADVPHQLQDALLDLFEDVEIGRVRGHDRSHLDQVDGPRVDRTVESDTRST